MKRAATLLAMAGMLGALSVKKSEEFIVSSKPTKPKSKNKPSKRGWYRSPESPYFGQRSNPVTAKLPNGETKRMKLKNALKHNYEFEF